MRPWRPFSLPFPHDQGATDGGHENGSKPSLIQSIEVHMNRTTATMLVALVAMGGFLSIQPADAVTYADSGAWKVLLDPLGETPTLWVAAVAGDGDYALLYETTAGQPKFAISAPGSDTFTKTTINASVGFDVPQLVAGDQDDEWYALFGRNATQSELWRSTDDGSTWTLRQTIGKEWADLALESYGARVGVVVADAGDDTVYWYRSSDDGASFDREAIAVFGPIGDLDTNQWAVEIAAWPDDELQIFNSYERVSTNQNAVHRIYSNDAGSFWDGGVQGCSHTLTNQPVFQDLSVGLGTNFAVVMCTFTDNDNRMRYIHYDSADDSGTLFTLQAGATVNHVGEFIAAVDQTAYIFQRISSWDVHTWTPGGATDPPDNIDPNSLPVPTGDLIDFRTDGTYLYGAVRNSGFSDRFEVHIYTLLAGPGGDASVAVTDLVGFDVDATGKTVIARTEAGPNIRTYNALPLTVAAGSPHDSECTRVGGVTASENFIAHLECDVGDPADVIGIHIQTRLLTEPDFAALCDPEDFCSDFSGQAIMGDTRTSEGSGTPDGDDLDDWIDIAHVLSVPIDYGAFSTTGNNHVPIALAYTDSNGRVGVMVYTWVNNAADNVVFDSDLFTSQTPDALAVCAPALSIKDDSTDNPADNTQFRLYTASNIADPRAYNVVVERTDGAFQVAEYTPTMTTVFAGSGNTVGANSVACGTGAFVYGTPTTLTVWDCLFCGSASPVLTKSVSGIKTNGVAMNEADGSFVAYVDDDGGHVICAAEDGCFNELTNTTVALGEEVYSFALPPGNFKGIKMQGAASYLWVATSDFIVRHDVSGFTTGSDQTYNPSLITLEEGPAPEVEQVGGGFLGDQLQSASDETGISVTTFGWIMAGITMVMTTGLFGGLVWAGTGKTSLTLAAAGGGLLLGFVLSITMALLDAFWATFVIMVLVAVVIILFLMRGR